MNCIVCNKFSRTHGAACCDCNKNKPLHACCVEEITNESGRCLTCNTSMYRAGASMTDLIIRWEEALIIHFSAAVVDFLWIIFMYIGFNTPWFLPGWGLYYYIQLRKLKRISDPLWKKIMIGWVLWYPVLNGIIVTGAAPRWAFYLDMDGNAILADLVPLFFYTLCIERGKHALIWMLLPRRMKEEKKKERAFLGAYGMWWDNSKWKGILFGIGWTLYFVHIFIVRGTMHNAFLLPFYCGFVFLIANMCKPLHMAKVSY